jgi:hypothetical protein
MRGLRRFLYASAEDIPAAGGLEKVKGVNSCGERARTQWPLGRQRLCLIGRRIAGGKGFASAGWPTSSD